MGGTGVTLELAFAKPLLRRSSSPQLRPFLATGQKAPAQRLDVMQRKWALWGQTAKHEALTHLGFSMELHEQR